VDAVEKVLAQESCKPVVVSGMCEATPEEVEAYRLMRWGLTPRAQSVLGKRT